MAGDWIKVQTCTPDKPEVHLIAERLGIDPDAVTGKLIRIWCWADQQTADGNAASVTRSLLDRVSGVTGFADSLISVGWLEKTDAGFRFPNFDRHNGNSAKTRASVAKRVEKHRKTAESESANVKRKCNAETVTAALPEKRREEKRRDLETHTVADATPAVIGTKTEAAPLNHIMQQFVAAFGGQVHATAKRKSVANQRWRDAWWRSNWQEALERACQSPFLQGQTSERGWRMDLDFFLRPDTVAKILEGKYDDSGKPNGQQRLTPTQQREQNTADAFAIFERAHAELAARSDQGSGVHSGTQAIGFVEKSA